MKLHKKVARRVFAQDLYFHGTSTAHLDSILSDGLVPSPPKERWTGDMDFKREGPVPKSFEGVYLIDQGRKARRIAGDASKKFGGNPLVAVVEVGSREGVAIDNDHITTSARKAVSDWVQKEMKPFVRDFGGKVRDLKSFALGYLLIINERDQIVYGRDYLSEIHEDLSLSGDLDVDIYDISGELARKALLVMLSSMADPTSVDFSNGVMTGMGYTAEEVERMGSREKRNVRSIVEKQKSKYPLRSNPQSEWDDLVLQLGKHYGSQRMEGEDSILIPEQIGFNGSNKIVALMELRGLTPDGDLTESVEVVFHHGTPNKGHVEALGIPADSDTFDVEIKKAG